MYVRPVSSKAERMLFGRDDIFGDEQLWL
jgi:hypothetical protein